ncbi:Tetratricopeptide repeat protein [Roseimaritima multifibrata]|uniref:Tetratricopeptide repeat protein n=1 Tax=Roseimaritima multifibrata TaxID=1930274 RepID=A0A517MNP1_9BACT|nr:tetratricopeptide repeat protein [Roseimaritima multifibrata]QDS96494.1 Tetratricopeptide repeat protein [Roseimaritima multifibrata]
MPRYRLYIASLAVLVAASTSLAHDGPHDVIARLSEKISVQGPTADLLFRRACEYRALRDYQSAKNDLRHALRLDPTSEFTQIELIRLQLAGGESTDLLPQVDALLDSRDTAVRTAGHAIRGEIFLAQQQWQAAIAEFDIALKNHRSEIQWYLWRAEAQRKSGQTELQIHDLRRAYEFTASPVLQAALCDALIADADRNLAQKDERASASRAEAFAMIEQKLRDSRLKSAWRIRKAEVLLLSDDHAAANRELDKAIAELDARLATPHPDPMLVQDRLKAMHLMH